MTATEGNPVTEKMREDRATEIAKTLGNASKWHSHGRGISMKELTGNDVKLVIDDFGIDPGLNPIIRNYHGLAVDYFSKKMQVRVYIHSQHGLRAVA